MPEKHVRRNKKCQFWRGFYLKTVWERFVPEKHASQRCFLAIMLVLESV